MSRGPLGSPLCFWALASTRTGWRNPSRHGLRAAVPGSLVLLVWGWALLAWLMWGIGEARTVAQVGGLAIPTYAGCRRARGRQGAAWKRRRCLSGRVPAGLDAPLRAAAARFGGRDGRMLAARVEPKNGPKKTGTRVITIIWND